MINICSSIRKRRTMLERGRIWLKLATLLVLVVLVWTMARWMRAEGDGGDLRLTAGGVQMESAVQGQLIGPPVRIDVYYETLCPDSRSFVATQLMPAVNNFPPEVLQITLVPYGKASTREGGDTGYTFDCQHGPPECEGNKVHACAIAHNRKKDTRNIVRYVDCMIHNNRMPMEIGKKCNEELNFGSWDDIADCANGKEGSQLLAKYGDMTHALNPPVDFIPTVIINGKRSEMWKALKNLKAVVCDKYPFTPMERDQYC